MAALAPRALLVLLAVLAPALAEASVPRGTSVWESNPPAERRALTRAEPPVASPLQAALEEPSEASSFSLFIGHGLAAGLAEKLPQELGGDIANVPRTPELTLELHQDVGLLTIEPRRGPPDSLSETRVWGFDIPASTGVGLQRQLTLELRQGYECFGPGLATDECKDPLGLAGDDDTGETVRHGTEVILDWALRKGGLQSKGSPNEQVAEEARREGVLGPNERLSYQPAGGFSNRVRGEVVAVVSTAAGAGAVVAREAIIYYTQEKVGEFAARVVIGGVTRSFRTLQEAAQFAREEKAAARYIPEATGKAPSLSAKGTQFEAAAAGAAETTPNTAAREYSQGRFVDPFLDANVLTGERLAADHVFPKSRIKQLVGFSELSRANKRQVLNYLPNMQGLPKSFNSSKGARLAEEWSHIKGEPMNPAYRTWLGEAQGLLKEELEELIASLVYEQQGIHP